MHRERKSAEITYRSYRSEIDRLKKKGAEAANSSLNNVAARGATRISGSPKGRSHGTKESKSSEYSPG